MNWATKVAKKVNAMKNYIMMKMLAEESAGKKLGFSDLLNKNGGSKTLISVDGKVSVYFEKRTGDDVRFICRIIRKGPQDIIKKSKSLQKQFLLSQLVKNSKNLLTKNSFLKLKRVRRIQMNSPF